MLLTYLEQKVFKKPTKMDDFLKKYVEKFSKKSIVSEQFQDFLNLHLKSLSKESCGKGIDWKYWFNYEIPKDKKYKRIKMHKHVERSNCKKGSAIL